MREPEACGKVERSSLSIVHRSFFQETSMVYGTSIAYKQAIDDDSSPSQFKQRAIAEKLLSQLGEPKSWKFYLKCAYHLSEDEIWRLVELAMKPNVKSPNRYFVTLATKAMR